MFDVPELEEYRIIYILAQIAKTCKILVKRDPRVFNAQYFLILAVSFIMQTKCKHTAYFYEHMRGSRFFFPGRGVRRLFEFDLG